MSETLKDQLADLRRSKAMWEDDPAQKTPFPHNDALAELEEMVASGLAEDPAMRASRQTELKAAAEVVGENPVSQEVG